MATRRKTTACMSAGEQVAGVIFLAVYLLVLPFATTPLFHLVERLLNVSLSQATQELIYYDILFVLTIVIFHGFLARTARNLASNFAGACGTLIVGLLVLYGLNELMYRLTHLLVNNRTNLNDLTISGQLESAPWTMVLIVIFLAPLVEEVLFRGLVFGGLRTRSRVLAYGVSCILFALVHVWQFVLVNCDLTYFLLMVQYLAPGVVLAWAYDHSGSLWTSIGLHALANALSVWAILG